MSKVIVTTSKNGAENILLSRQATNDSNWKEDFEAWQAITVLDEAHITKKTKKNGESRFSISVPTGRYTKKGKPKYKTDSFLTGRFNTLAAKIANNNAIDYGIDSEDDVELWMVKDMLTWLLPLPKKGQMHLCRNASRQSLDEEVQIAMLAEALPGMIVEKPGDGKYTLKDGRLDAKKNIKNKNFARSVDVLVKNMAASCNNPVQMKAVLKGQQIWTAYGFAKYSGPVGSVTDVHQTGESKSYLNEAVKYCEKNDDDARFFVQVDGAAGESHIDDLRRVYKGYEDRIFAGNTESVIDWLAS